MWLAVGQHCFPVALHAAQQPLAVSSTTTANNGAARSYSLNSKLQQLQDVEFTDTSYHLGAKIIQLKSYFELEETEAFYSLIKAFRNLGKPKELHD